jgi:hypothetical protein
MADIQNFCGQRASRFEIYVWDLGGRKPIGLAGALPRERALRASCSVLGYQPISWLKVFQSIFVP